MATRRRFWLLIDLHVWLSPASTLALSRNRRGARVILRSGFVANESRSAREAAFRIEPRALAFPAR